MRTLTGLDPEEFRDLEPTFAQVWAEHTQSNWLGQKRQRAKGGGSTGELDTPAQKLFFILVYLRVYPVQEIQGAFFGFTQSQANKWILRLIPLLHAALQRHLALPERHGEDLEQILAQCRQAQLLLDGTDRPVRRPQDPERQKDCYSGRKKRHTVKNLVLVQERRILFLSPTAAGRRTDKRLAEPLEAVRFPADSAVVTDAGFQGLNLQGTLLAQPTKKPKGKPLAPVHQAVNRLIARVRVPVEHVIGSAKRCRIVSDVFRNLKAGLDDTVMELACRLHNFREYDRAATRAALASLQLN